MTLSRADVLEILGLLDEAGFDELNLRTDRFALTLRREPGGWTQELTATGRPAVIAGHAAGATAAGAPPRADPPGGEGLHDVRAPLPGTFYRAPKPGDPPFVELGARVEPHSVVGLIETMKLFNSVTAGAHGCVVEILLGDGELAQHNAVLVRIEPDLS
jgi:acetyl-CoA carboxylase biotin carboxyl carrier protein